MKRCIWLVLFIVVLLPSVASAHAILVESSISNGAMLDIAPLDVTLRFSEAIDPESGSIELYGEDSIPIALERVTFPTPDSMQVALPETLRPGSYTLIHKVLSVADGHTSTGFLLFSIGTDMTPVAASVSLHTANEGPGGQAIAAKSFQLVSGLTVVGGLVWLVTLLLPALRVQPDPATAPLPRRTIWVIQWATLGLIVGTLAEFALRAADQGDGTIASVQYADVLSSLATSRWGMLALLRLGVATLLMPLVFLAGYSRGAGEAAIGLSVISLLTFSMSGHAAGTANPLIPIVADWLHLLMGAIWFGGVLGLTLVVWGLRRASPAVRTRLLVRLIGRFSPVALTSIVLVTLTGVIRSLNQIPTLAEVWTTTYGRILLIKLVVLGAALVLGGRHWRRVGPRLQAAVAADDHRAAGRFGRTIALESSLAIVVVLIAGVLTQTPHPVVASASAGGTAPATLPTALPVVDRPLRLTSTAEGLTITLDLDDQRPGNRRFTATISDTTGLIAPDRVRLRFAGLDLETGQQIAILERQPDGTYAGQSGALSFLGRWQIELQVRRMSLPDVTVEWTVEMTR